MARGDAMDMIFYEETTEIPKEASVPIAIKKQQLVLYETEIDSVADLLKTKKN